LIRRQQLVEAMKLGPLWLPRGMEVLEEEAVESFATPAPLPAAAPTPEAAPIAAPIAATSVLAEATIPALAPVQAYAPAPPAGEQLSWEELQQAVSACRRCRLCETRRQTVFGRGSPKARLLLVGEAPGENEDKQGEAFVGRAGQLLDNMLGAIGLDSNADVFITNVLKCRPPGNRNPAGDEIVACQNYLTQQIAHLQPTMILALGRFAAQTLLVSDQSITRLRGRLHSYQNIPLIVTFHPAYLLRNLPDKSKAWQDLVLLKRTLGSLQG
jgi:DNA polymerase